MQVRKILSVSVYLVILFAHTAAYAQDSVKIAAIFARTGSAADHNVASLTGVQLAVSEINAEGGVLGKKLELLTFDNKSTPIGSKLAATRAVSSGAIAIIGPAPGIRKKSVMPWLKPMTSPVLPAI